MPRKKHDPDYEEPNWLHTRRSDFDDYKEPNWWETAEKRRKKFDLRLSNTEIQHLAVATIIITLIFGLGFAGISGLALLSGDIGVSYSALAVYLGIALVAVGSAFILHEMAHKVVAQRFGCWAEFRYNLFSLLFTGLIAIMISFFIIAPGAVIIQGYLTKKQNGLVSLAGPLTNLVLGIVFIPLFIFGVYFDSSILVVLGFFGGFINFFIGAFNMIPLGNFDGAKILRWNPIIWVVMAVLLGGPVIYIYWSWYFA
jgi:Zn-dependent protease